MGGDGWKGTKMALSAPWLQGSLVSVMSIGII